MLKFIEGEEGDEFNLNLKCKTVKENIWYLFIKYIIGAIKHTSRFSSLLTVCLTIYSFYMNHIANKEPFVKTVFVVTNNSNPLNKTDYFNFLDNNFNNTNFSKTYLKTIDIMTRDMSLLDKNYRDSLSELKEEILTNNKNYETILIDIKQTISNNNQIAFNQIDDINKKYLKLTNQFIETKNFVLNGIDKCTSIKKEILDSAQEFYSTTENKILNYYEKNKKYIDSHITKIKNEIRIIEQHICF